jgi:hypothetical protein
MILAGAELLITMWWGHAVRLSTGTGLVGPLAVALASGLIACGLATWFHPVQRSVYSTVAILLAIAALTTADVGGFLAGTLIGAAGGSLGFAWVPTGQPERRRRQEQPGSADGGRTLTLIVTDASTETD